LSVLLWGCAGEQLGFETGSIRDGRLRFWSISLEYFGFISGLVKVVVLVFRIVFFFFFFFSFPPALSQQLLDLRVAEHLNLLVGESALDAVIVPAETVITEILEIRRVFESLFRVHEEGVGFSIITKMGELKGKEIILTMVSTYRMRRGLAWHYLCDGRNSQLAWLRLHRGLLCSSLLCFACGCLCLG
jgi:hypothetical protein